MNSLKSCSAAAAAAILLAPLPGCVANDPGLATTDHDSVGASAAGTSAHSSRYPALDQKTRPLRYTISASLVTASADAAIKVRRDQADKPLRGRLQFLAGDMRATHAVLLVAGIHDSYRYFDNWVSSLASASSAVIGWDHDHRSMKMADSARALAQDIIKLREAGVTDVMIIAHSIGGLVAKGAIDELSRNGKTQSFNRLDLQALGTPWGGFAIVEIVLKVPGSIAVSSVLGYPMAQELRPGSDYLASLTIPMPANGRMHIYVGNADHVAIPITPDTRRRYASIEANAAMVATVEGVGHNDYSHTPVLVSFARNMYASDQYLANACGLTNDVQDCAGNPSIADIAP